MLSWQKTHPVALKRIAKVPNQKVARRPKCFSFFFLFLFFFFFFFFFFFRRASSNLRDSFTMVFAQNSGIFHWAVHQPIAFFSRFEVTRGDSNRSQKNYGFLYDAIFFHVYTCAQITLNFELLATKCNYYARLLNYKYCWCAGSVWRKPSQYYIGSLCGETCCSVIDGKLLLKHASTAKKNVTWTRIKNIKNVTRCRDSRSAKSIETR